MSEIWVVVIGGTLVTFLPRIAPILFLSGRKMPRLVERWLSLVAPAILSALLFPELLLSSGSLAAFYEQRYVYAALPAFLVAWKSKSLFGAVAAGMASAALLRLLF
ncbi:branched-chain amino acid ABC transporter [Synergistales bacterium]|nr:branched-chain amino acid ABC transporter [Synergistales bacterium]